MRSTQNLKKLFLILLMLPLNFLFNNCSKGAGGALVLQATDLASEADLKFSAGKTTYSTNCAACHGDIDNSTKLYKTSSDITQAIANQPQMKFLASLTADDISKIAYALSFTPSSSGSTESKVTTEYQALTTNRYMMVSNLTELFVTDGTPDASDTAISTSITNLVNAHPEAFGGNCSRNDTSCVASCNPSGDVACIGRYEILANASPTPPVNAITQGYLTQVCEEILSVDKATKTALGKVGITVIVAPSTAEVTKVVQFFTRDKPVDTASVNSLISVADQARIKGYSVLDQWRFLLLPLCVSSTSELL